MSPYLSPTLLQKGQVEKAHPLPKKHTEKRREEKGGIGGIVHMPFLAFHLPHIKDAKQGREEKRSSIWLLRPFCKEGVCKGQRVCQETSLTTLLFSSFLRKDNKDTIGRGKNGCMGSLVEQVVPFSLLVAQPTDELAPCRSWPYLLLYPFVKGREREGWGEEMRRRRINWGLLVLALVEQVVPFSLLVAQPTDELAPYRSWSYLLLYPLEGGGNWRLNCHL